MLSPKWGYPNLRYFYPKVCPDAVSLQNYYLTIIKLPINYFSLKKSLSVYFVETTSEVLNIKGKIARSVAWTGQVKAPWHSSQRPFPASSGHVAACHA